MALKVTKVDVWAGEMQDQPGGLAQILEALASARASVDCVIARRQPAIRKTIEHDIGSTGRAASLGSEVLKVGRKVVFVFGKVQ